MTGRETLGTRLRERALPAPAELAERIDDLVAAHAGPNGAAPADAPIDVAIGAMRALLHDGCLTRASALDLLAIDALVTYAFEAAADEPERLEERAGQALARIAALTAPYAA